MMKRLGEYADYAYAALRIVSGFLFMFHGLQKTCGILTEHQPPMGSQIWLGGVIELVGGALIMLGFQTRVAAFVCSGQMAVAYFQFHWRFNFGAGFFPAINQGELAVVNCFLFLLIACRGGVKWCLDRE